jgi:hypothetical protein
MREAIGGTWLTQLVIVFMFVFVAFLALSMNYSKAFKVKNETLSFVEKNEGITSDAIEFINNYLSYSGYGTTGYCDNGSYGIKSLDNSTKELVSDSNSKTKYYYCISKVKSPTTNFKYRSYYKVKLFFKFNLPVVGDIFTFNVDGQTKDVIYPADGHCESNANVQCN